MNSRARSFGGGILKWVPLLTLAILVGPIAAGLIGTLLPAFGYLPALGGNALGFGPWRELFELPGLVGSLAISLTTGLATTLLALAVVTAFCASWQGRRWFQKTQRLLSLLLSIPHVTVAFGIAFILAPSGWLLRLFSPWATGFEQPQDWLIVHDPYGVSLILGLVAKEVPFLLLMTLSASGQAEVQRSQIVAATLGYGPVKGWLSVVFPRIYRQIRLPVLAVLAYGISVVDVALVLGPTNPAPLAIRLVRLFNDPELSFRFVASAGACVQCVLVVIGVGLWWVGEHLAGRLGLRWITSGSRWQNDRPARVAAGTAMLGSMLAVLAGLASMGLWAFATTWRFPRAWPERLSLSIWSRHVDDISDPLVNTMTIAAVTAVVSVALAIGCLEQEARSGRRSWLASTWALYLPLLLPQVAFLFGIQMLLVSARLDGHWLAVAWLHFVFAFPYVFLALADAYRAWDARYERTASCIGARPFTVFLKIKLPMLLRPVVIAATLGFAVSVGLYLPTLLGGGGRHPTITTEAVALSSANDYRVIGIYALMQMLLPLAVFGAGVGWVAWRFRNRKGMQVA